MPHSLPGGTVCKPVSLPPVVYCTTNWWYLYASLAIAMLSLYTIVYCTVICSQVPGVSPMKRGCVFQSFNYLFLESNEKTVRWS